MSMVQNFTGLAGTTCASCSLCSQWCSAAKISSAVSSPHKGVQDLCWCWKHLHCFVLLIEKDGWGEPSMLSWDNEKVTRPRVSGASRQLFSQVSMLFTMLRLGAQIVLPQKAVSLAEPQILVFKGVLCTECHPKEGGMLSYSISGRHCHCSECKWAEELNRWLQWDMDSLQMVNSFPLRSVVGWMTAQYGSDSKSLYYPPHTLLSWHFPLWRR